LLSERPTAVDTTPDADFFNPVLEIPRALVDVSAAAMNRSAPEGRICKTQSAGGSWYAGCASSVLCRDNL
jgi:hypothetical protein